MSIRMPGVQERQQTPSQTPDRCTRYGADLITTGNLSAALAQLSPKAPLFRVSSGQGCRLTKLFALSNHTIRCQNPESVLFYAELSGGTERYGVELPRGIPLSLIPTDQKP